MGINKYINELKRRNVFKAAVAYIVFAWLLLQVGSTVLPILNAPEYYMKLLLILLAVGLPLWLIFVWIYEITPEGLKKTQSVPEEESITRDTSNKLNKIIITTLSVVVLLLAYQLLGKSFADGSSKEKSIAVLAFADMSPQKDQEYFSDGISEELLNLLARNPELRVISRTSSFSYKNKDVTTEQIGKELNVTHILEGSIRKSGNTIRVTAQLIDIEKQGHAWSETFDRDYSDILKIQDEISALVSEKLQLTILGKDAKNRVVDPEAYTLYLKSLYLVNQTTKEAYVEAEPLIKRAIALDDSYAPFHALLAGINQTGSYNFMTKPLSEAKKEGIASARKAIELDPEYGMAYVDLASLLMMDWEFKEAQESMDKALELDPGNSNIVGTVALHQFGGVDEAIRLIKKAIQLDPINYVNYYNLAHHYYHQGNLAEAERTLNTFRDHYPNSGLQHYVMSRIKIAQGDLESAVEEAERESNIFFSLYARNFAYHAAGRDREADALLAELIDTYGETEAANMADIHAFRGEHEKAFKWLDKALEIRDPVILEILYYPSFDGMRADPRWS
ncbi:MAG: tetratricopeptide repeat protein, partial [Flavobacteriaceae bacterium]|nr:tetratricopeptide repeat protein [Flavobacteriaceae bacterium]